ncbi:MAG: GIY-YIG nuclease family protein [Candidatus Omnitrophica bacterium]|nr:GIY-YIG nuclease family protein [Candidatus Omnitrophota bacterium]
MYFVYVLQSEIDFKFYIGYTGDDPLSRLDKHNNGEVDSTKLRKPFKLIYYEAYINQKDALGREQFLKSGSGHRYLNKQLKNFLEKNE